MEETIKIADFLKENKITIYKLAKNMGKNPDSASYTLGKKVKGELPVRIEELKNMINALNSITNKNLPEKDFSFDVMSVKI